MLSRLIPRAKFRLTTLISSQQSFHSSSFLSNPNFNFIYQTPKHFSTNRNNNGGDDSSKPPPSSSSIPNNWKFTPDDDEQAISIFDEDDGDFTGFNDNQIDKKSQVKSSSSGIGRSDVVNVKSIWGEEDSLASDIFGDVDNEGGKPHEKSSSSSSSSGIGRSNVVNVKSTWGDEDSLASDIFGNVEKEFVPDKKGGSGVIGENVEWGTDRGKKIWDFAGKEEEEEKTEIFDVGDGSEGISLQIEKTEADEILEREKIEADLKLEEEKNALSVQLKGPDRAFGDLIAASGITDAMLDSLIALKDLEAMDGLPPLSEIEDIRLHKNEKKSDRAEIERQKLEEIAKSHVRKVDDKGRAYGTGRRKCSVARVFIQPGEGKFLVNDKQFDVYFPILDHRADLLRPFTETKTLGLWDIACTVKGGGVSGQVGAIRLGISRALQNWEPGLRPCLKAVGFLTRDPRVVERKKPGKAKARKSFQWVKR